jgi:flagellar motility protein MotE (MotC chaperone)
MDRVIKLTVSEEEADKLTVEAKKRDIPRTDLLREIVVKYLQRSPAGPDTIDQEARGQVLTLSKSLEESQRDREALRERIKTLEETLSEKMRDLEWTRGQYAALTSAHGEALRKIPPPPALLEDGRPRPSWWQRLFGGGGTSPPDQGT